MKIQEWWSRYLSELDVELGQTILSSLACAKRMKSRAASPTWETRFP